MQDCITAFGGSTEADLQNDASWNLQIVPPPSIASVISNCLSVTSAATLSAVGNNTNGCY